LSGLLVPVQLPGFLIFSSFSLVRLVIAGDAVLAKIVFEKSHYPTLDDREIHTT